MQSPHCVYFSCCYRPLHKHLGSRLGNNSKRSLEDEMCPTCIYLLETLLFVGLWSAGWHKILTVDLELRNPKASEATPVCKSQTHTNSIGCNWQKHFWELTKVLQWDNTSKGALWTLLLFWGLPGHWNHPCKSSFFAANFIQNLYSLFPKAVSSNIIGVNLVLVNPWQTNPWRQFQSHQLLTRDLHLPNRARLGDSCWWWS